MITRLLGVLLVAIAAGSALAVRAQEPASSPDIEAAFERFWDADSPGQAEDRVQALLRTGVDFDVVLTRLREGRSYGSRPTGVRQMPYRTNGVTLENVVEIPDNYDPSQAWPLRVQLHGGVGRPLAGNGARPLNAANNRIRGEDQIYVHPRAYSEGAWWHEMQVANVLRLVDAVKREYNVDESQIYITGVSDGGTGTYFYALREAMLWSSCLTLNGHPMVLANPATNVDGQLYLGNLVNCPLYVVNGGRDRLYPAAGVVPLIDAMRRAGVPVEFHVYPEAGHDTSWWPEEQPAYEGFVRDHPRDPQPATVSFETERTDRYNRFRWLVIEALGAAASDRSLEEVNTFLPNAQSRDIQMFQRRRLSGRVDVTRTGNRFVADTRGVERFTILLSPDVVDFNRPVTVVVNGRRVFEAPVQADVETLLTWAARDNDRTMLYGAAVTIAVP